MARHRTQTSNRRLYLMGAFAITLSTVCISSSQAQQATELREITDVELETLAEGARTQAQVESLDDRRMQLAAEYRHTLKQNANLTQYNTQLSQTIASQEEEMVSLEQQINNISHLERDIVPLMNDMLDALDKFVQLDLPFLKQERVERIHKLRSLLVTSKVSNSERYRRILEAYQIENDYGRSIEAYEDNIQLPGSDKPQRVTFLKVGRIAYLLQTLDGQQSYLWQNQERYWQALDARYNSAITEGIKMAKEQIPSNLMFVPITVTAQVSQTDF